MEKEKYDLIVVGAGIIGLSTALEIAKKWPKKGILIIDKENEISNHQTGRNSGVIHSGIYYQPNSLKAKNCLLGYNLLVQFAKNNNIPFELTGKLIVATTNKQVKSLLKLYDFGTKNGLKGLKILDQKGIQSVEPHCKNATKALYVPQSGIIDYKKVSEKLLELLIKVNVSLKLNCKLIDIKNKKNHVELITKTKSFFAKKVVLCTGVYSDKFISSELKGKFRILPFKGEYFKLKESHKYLVKGLIYPVPDLDLPFLGVHLTKTINGDIEAGPNAVLSLSREGYQKFSFNIQDFISIVSWKGFWIFSLNFWKVGLYEISRSISKVKFTKSLKELVPGISVESLEKGNTGIRAQIISKEGKLMDDFLIDKNNNIINVVNAPSPAATSCFAIAKQIVKII